MKRASIAARFTRQWAFLRLVRAHTGPAFARMIASQSVGALSEIAMMGLFMPLLRSMGGAGAGWHVAGWHVTLPLLLAAIIGLAAVRAVAIVRREKVSTALTSGFVSGVIERLFTALAVTRWSVINRWRVADMTQLVTGSSEKLMNAVFHLLAFTQSIIVALAYGVLSLLVSWQMSLLGAMTGIALMAFTLRAQKNAMQHGERLATAYRDQFRIADEFLSGLRTAKAFGLERQHLDAMRDILSYVRRENASFSVGRAKTNGAIQFLVVCAMALFVLVSIYVLGISLPETLTLIFIFMRLVPRLTQIHTAYHELQTSLGGVQSLVDLLHLAESNRQAEGDEATGEPRLREAISIEGVSFAYDRQMVLADVSLRIPAHRLTVIVGATGSGKSTLVDLILGFAEPASGEIRIDGAALSSANARSWQRRVAYVPQDTYLFNATIAANLRMVCPQATDADLWWALGLADAEAFVRALPLGLDHAVGDRGRNLSGGERQRLAIARALLRRPDLLLLDEATSALDVATQARVLEALAGLKGAMTILAVAHRPELIAMADQVIAFEQGQVRQGHPGPGQGARAGDYPWPATGDALDEKIKAF